MGYFYDKFSKDALNKAYELLENVTPLTYDCGLLCSGACCGGGDKDGMLLFPGEREYFEKLPGFRITANEAYGYDCVVCSGECDRADRPLSCRIFPYFFYVNGEGKITPAPDIRAAEICPLAGKKIEVSGEYLKRLRLCARVFAADSEITGFLASMTEKLTDFGGLDG